MVNSAIAISFHHKMAMKRCLEDSEIEKQLSARYMTWDCAFPDASRSIIQRRALIQDAGDEA
jgi:hypothetical protein